MGLNEINTVLFMSKTSKIQCMECNSVNDMHVQDVEDIKIHVRFVICSHSYSNQRPQAGGTGVGTIREERCTEVGVGELPQLMQYVKTHTTPTPNPTTLVKHEMEEQEQKLMDVGAVKIELDKPIVEKPIHVSFRGLSIGVVTVTLPLKGLKSEWTPTLEVCTHRRLCCAPSVHFLCTTLIH